MPPGTEHDPGNDSGLDFEAFARTVQRKLYRTAYLLCGNADGARDLTQTTLAKLFQHWRRVSVAQYPEAYARTVLTRTFLAERRRRLRDLLAHTRADPPPLPDHAELRVSLLAVLAELPPRARAMVVLRYWDDLSVETVAAPSPATSCWSSPRPPASSTWSRPPTATRWSRSRRSSRAAEPRPSGSPPPGQRRRARHTR